VSRRLSHPDRPSSGQPWPAAGGILAVSLLLAGTGFLSGATSLGPVGRPSPVQAVTSAPYSIGVLVIKYFPLTADGQNIDISVTGDVGGSAASVEANVAAMTDRLPQLLSQGTEYRGYENPTAPPSVTYRIVDTVQFNTPVPVIPSTFNSNYPMRADYHTIMSNVGICSYVQNRGVQEVWIWAYQGPHQLDISESKMSGPYGDISNSYRLNDMPQCGRTYTVYTFNYGRGVALAVHSYDHQLEAELTYMDAHLFRDIFEGPNYPYTLHVMGRCGSVHNPPNARYEYDWRNPASNPSDCNDWNPNGLGTLQPISCATWTCHLNGENDDPQLHYLIWWMQHFPGLGNTLTYHGLPMRNWWDVHGDFDAAVRAGRSLTIQIWAPTTSALGNTTTGPFSSATKIQSRGGYITWRVDGGSAVANQLLEVWVYKKYSASGKWEGPTLLTTRRASSDGIAYLNIRSGSVLWMSVRPKLPSASTRPASWGPTSIGLWQ